MRRLTQAIQILFHPADFIQLKSEVGVELTRLAENEQRPLDELGNELLGFALDHRRDAEQYLDTWKSLTPREQEITALACLGYTNRHIAKRLMIVPDTVKTHLQNATRKFGLRSKLGLRTALADWDFHAWEHPPSG